MAKDDYYVIVYKILAYLYVQLKAGENVDPKMIAHDGSLFKINERYWTYIIENMANQGFIEGVSLARAWGRELMVTDMSGCRITPAGIAFLCDNNLMEKAKKFLKDMKEITPFI